MKKLVFVLVPLFMFAITVTIKNPIVYIAGAMKNFMMDGDLSAKTDLNSLKKLEHLYALGASENLQGEIIILDSKPYHCFVQDKKAKTETTLNTKAALLVYSQVNNWKSIEIPDSVKNYKDLELYVKIAATKVGLNIDEPFPFLINGNVVQLNYHIIDWKSGVKHTMENHKQFAMLGNVQNSGVEILGFYSTKHKTIFTHHTTNMHLHFFNKQQNLAGHIDSLNINSSMKLLLPNN